MPKWIRNFLYSRDIKTHFIYACLLGLFFRLLCAWFVYGPQALDDYKHGVYPAYQFATGQALDLPDYRSHLLIWFLAVFIKIAGALDFTSALAQVRAMYIGLGLTSLTGLFGTYLFVRRQRSKVFAGAALYLVALFPLMPFVSTRAFGEAVAMSLVMLAFGILEGCERPNVRVSFLGFLILGVATLFRFHVGLMFVLYGLVVLVRQNWRAVAGGVLAGLVTIALQSGIDLLSGKEALGTLWSYLAANEGGAAQYGVSPWFNPLVFLLGVSLAPFSVVLWPAWRSLWKRQEALLIPWIGFVIAHCVVPHKEERFLYPVLGLEMWAVANLWAANAFNKYARRFYASVLVGLTIVLLPAVCLINSQEGEIEPPAYIESHYKKVVYLDDESLFGASRFQFYFLRPPSLLQPVDASAFNAHSIDEAFEKHPDFNAVALLTSKPEDQSQLHALEDIQTLSAKCSEMRTAGSVVDRLLYRLNPKHNQRRRPTWYLICERS